MILRFQKAHTQIVYIHYHKMKRLTGDKSRNILIELRTTGIGNRTEKYTALPKLAKIMGGHYAKSLMANIALS